MTEDMYQAMRLLTAIGVADTDRHAVSIPGAPWSKARPIVTKKGAFAPKDDRLAEARTRTFLSQAFAEPYTGNVALACLFYRPNRQRIDTDNLLKHVCDSATGVVWIDDSQCTALLGVTELDEENPRTILAFAPHVTTMTRGTDATRACARCGTPFNIIGVTKGRQYCSRECYSLDRHGSWLAEPIPCASCGVPFKRTTKLQRFCSPACRSESLRGRNRARGNPPKPCAVCGAVLPHRRGGMCRACWILSVKAGA